jgi:uracil-DNA glycosylase family 4
METAAELDRIALSVRGCVACRLATTRAHPVPGAGPVGTGLVFVGEAPGRHEDERGQPFLGASGRFLDRAFAEAGLSFREMGYVLPVVKCRPPKNRDPRPDEVAACRPFLVAQLAALRPRTVVTLGRFGLHAFVPGTQLGDVHGQWQRLERWPGDLDLGPYWLLPLVHPAAAMRFPRWRARFNDGLRALGLGPPTPPSAP